MIYKEHPRRNLIMLAIQIGIGLLIILIATLAFLSINSIIKWLLILAAVVLVGYPLVKYIFKKHLKKGSFHERHGRKLK